MHLPLHAHVCVYVCVCRWQCELHALSHYVALPGSRRTLSLMASVLIVVRKTEGKLRAALPLHSNCWTPGGHCLAGCPTQAPDPTLGDGYRGELDS